MATSRQIESSEAMKVSLMGVDLHKLNLTEMQERRVRMFLEGMSCEEIGRLENVTASSINISIGRADAIANRVKNGMSPRGHGNRRRRSE